MLFTALLYPLHGSLHLNGFYAATAALVPQGLHGLLKGEDGVDVVGCASGCLGATQSGHAIQQACLYQVLRSKAAGAGMQA